MALVSIFPAPVKRQRELNNLLFQAISDEFWPRVESLLKEGASPNARQEGNPMNALQTAVFYNASERITRILLENGAEVNSRTIGEAYTPLHLAAHHNKRAHIRTLLEFGADIEATDGEGDTPLHTAVRYGKLHAAAQLVALGAPLTVRNNDGKAPLHASVIRIQSMKGYNELMEAISQRHARRLHNIRRQSSRTNSQKRWGKRR